MRVSGSHSCEHGRTVRVSATYHLRDLQAPQPQIKPREALPLLPDSWVIQRAALLSQVNHLSNHVMLAKPNLSQEGCDFGVHASTVVITEQGTAKFLQRNYLQRTRMFTRSHEPFATETRPCSLAWFQQECHLKQKKAILLPSLQHVATLCNIALRALRAELCPRSSSATTCTHVSSCQTHVSSCQLYRLI